MYLQDTDYSETFGGGTHLSGCCDGVAHYCDLSLLAASCSWWQGEDYPRFLQLVIRNSKELKSFSLVWTLHRAAYFSTFMAKNFRATRSNFHAQYYMHTTFHTQFHANYHTVGYSNKSPHCHDKSPIDNYLWSCEDDIYWPDHIIQNINEQLCKTANILELCTTPVQVP